MAIERQDSLGEPFPAAPILVTGAAGKIGGILARRLAGCYPLILSDHHKLAETHGLPFVWSDLSDPESLRAACQGVHTVLHLAAASRPDAPWEKLLRSNLEGAYHLFEAAVQAGCRRVIFASSVMASDGYPDDVQVNSQMPPRPSTIYGATKVWGEALGSYYADQRGLSVICLRLGWVAKGIQFLPGSISLSMALTEDDLVRLVVSALDAPSDLHFGVFHGISDNRWKRWDITPTRQALGYAPQDDAYALARRNFLLAWLLQVKRLLGALKRKLQKLIS